MMHLQTVGIYLVPIITSYCLLGMFIRWLAYRSTFIKKDFHLFSGAAAIYWLQIGISWYGNGVCKD